MEEQSGTLNFDILISSIWCIWLFVLACGMTRCRSNLWFARAGQLWWDMIMRAWVIRRYSRFQSWTCMKFDCVSCIYFDNVLAELMKLWSFVVASYQQRSWVSKPQWKPLSSELVKIAKFVLVITCFFPTWLGISISWLIEFF